MVAGVARCGRDRCGRWWLEAATKASSRTCSWSIVAGWRGLAVSHFFSVCWNRSMLLCSSSRVLQGGGLRSWEGGVDLSGDVALEAADDLAFAEAFGGASLDVGAGGLVVADGGGGGDG